MKLYFSFLLFLISVLTHSQERISGTDAYAYSITHKESLTTIDYISVGEPLSSSKPTLLFLQGSLPIPLIFDFKQFKHINLPFNYKPLVKAYNIVVISMPETPVEAEKQELNAQYCYITDTTDQISYSEAYLKANVLETYVQRTKAVIKHIKQIQNGNTQALYLIGHSQGAKIASVVAANNTNINGVGLLGFNPLGRYDEMIRRLRQKFNMNALTEEEYSQQLKEAYAQWKAILDNPTDYKQGNSAWMSFSIDYSSYLKDITCPVFIGYGTEDLIARNSDLIPLKLIEGGNSTYTLKPYKGLNHNFFKLINGRPDRKSGGHWSLVVKDALDWLEQQ